MPITNVAATHIDTCLSCYLTDHHNRDGEALVGIIPRGQSVDEAASELADETESVGDDRVPADLTRDEIVLTFKRALRGVDLRHIGHDGRRTNVEPMDIDTDDSDRAQVWFLLTWESV